MAWTSYQIVLAVSMVITGSINTLSTKWADKEKVDGKPFNHPFFQACGMFLGELSCLFVAMCLVCRTRRRRDPGVQANFCQSNRLIFFPAAMLDMLGTSLMYVGLNLTFASSFQMLRGSVIIFTGLLSTAFLGRTIRYHEWFGMAVIVLGLILVGLADVFFSTVTESMNGIIAGDLIIIIAQITAATQMVYEEKFVKRLDVHPLEAVGWEGLFGFSVLSILLIPMYYIIVGQPFSTDRDGRLENALNAFHMMGQNWHILLATLGNIVSIALFNFSGISVTKELNATTRMVLDSVRTIIIWAVSLAVHWQKFNYKSFLLQLAGFFLLIMGMCIYNDLFFAPTLRRLKLLKPLEEIKKDSREVDDVRRDPIQGVDVDERSPLLLPPPHGSIQDRAGYTNPAGPGRDDYFDEDPDVYNQGPPNAANNIVL